MTFNYDDRDLGVEAHVSVDMYENEGAASSFLPVIKAFGSLRKAFTGAFRKGAQRKSIQPPASQLAPAVHYRPENLGDHHFPLPDDFVPRTRRARMDGPLPEDYKPQDRWNFDKR